MTKTQLIAAVVSNTMRSDKTTVIGIGIDLGIAEICSRHSFKQHRLVVSATLAAAASTLSLPTDCLQLIGVRVKRGDGVDTTDQSGSVIDIKAKDELVRLYPDLADSDVSGIPNCCYEENGLLTFIPKANLAYEIELTYDALEVFSDDTDSSNVARIDACIIAYATAYLFRSISMFESAQQYASEYERSLYHIVLSDDRRPGKIMQMHGVSQLGRKSEPAQWNENIYTND